MQPLAGQLDLAPGQPDAFMAVGGGNDRAGNLAAMSGIGKIEGKGAVIASGKLVNNLVAIAGGMVRLDDDDEGGACPLTGSAPSYSRVGASGKPGAVHYTTLRDSIVETVGSRS